MASSITSASHSHLFLDSNTNTQSSLHSSSSSFHQLNPSPFPWRPQSFTSLKHTSSHQPTKASSSTAPSQEQKQEEITPSRHNVWVNPKCPKASQLRQQSYDARYSSLIKYSHSLNTCNPTEEDVYAVLDGLGETPVEQDAVIILNKMDNPLTAPIALKYFQNKVTLNREVILYNVTLKVFRKCKDFDNAELLFEEMLKRGVQPDNITFTTIISCARMCNLPNKAVEFFEKMGEFGCKPDDVTYSAMIDAYGRAGDVSMALSLYDRARTERWRIDLVTFTTLIRIYGSSGNFDGALNVYEEMKALKVKPNLVTYNTLLDAMGRAKRPWQVKSIYKELVKSGLEPNSSTYAALLRAYCRSRYGTDALALYKEMREKGIELNVVLYNSMLSMCADIGFVEQCVEIYDDMIGSGTCKPDSWTFSSLITMYSCSGKVTEAENALNEMLQAGFEPNIFIFTSLIQCYGKANRVDDVVKTFNQLEGLGITPDDRFCGCLLNVMTQIQKEELGKVVGCIAKANAKLGDVVTLLIEEETSATVFKDSARELFGIVSKDVRKAYCNCLTDLCVNLNLLEKACELLDLGLTLGIYGDIQHKTPLQWSLQLKSLSLGAALTALHVWVTDLSKTVENGDELPPVLAINTGHGKHKYSEKGLAGVLQSHLKELNAPFHEAQDKVGWFVTTKVAAQLWLESRKTPELVVA